MMPPQVTPPIQQVPVLRLMSLLYPPFNQYRSTHNIALNAKFTPMQAAEIAFKEKRNKYDPHFVNLSSGDVFLPFVMESFGSIHIEGRKFLAKIQHRARHFYSQAMMISPRVYLCQFIMLVSSLPLYMLILHIQFSRQLERHRSPLTILLDVFLIS